MSSFSFAVGKKKTPFQRHKELEEEKKKKEADEAAKLYEDFVESFAEDPAEKGPKAFVRGEVIQPGQRPSDSGEPPRRAGKYVPKFLPPSMAAAFSTPEAKPPVLESVLPLPTPAAGSKGKPRQIDAVLENLKREQERREERQRMRKETGGVMDALDEEGSFDDGDPYTTNLYIGNLSTDVNEDVLKKEFGRFGPLASVKIMWPRDDDQRRRGRNCGFVAYMNREEAQRAKDDLNGIMLHDNDLRIGWGKSIPIPAAPMFVLNPPGGVAAPRGAAIAPPGQAAALAPWGSAVQTQQPTVPDIEVQFPTDARMRYIIDTMALYVLQDGCPFEQAVMLKEQSNPEFAFLFDLKSPEHVYYRWRLYSLANEDSLMRWHVEPFWLVEETARWIPPAMTLSGSGHQTAAQRGGEAKDKDKPLSDMQRDRFEDILRGLTVERKDICDAMIFALDNADSAFEIVEILTDALTLPETPIPTKVARLFLASDVLHNSTAPVRNASRYRSHLETSLPDIFESLQETYRSSDSRMAQEGLRRHVLRVLRMWRSWSIFSDDFLNGLQATFLRGISALAGGKREGSAGAAELEELDDEQLETRCRRNGLSKKGGRDMQIQRLLELQSYLNGGISDWPAQMAEPLIKQEAPQAATLADSISPGDHQAPPSIPQQNNPGATRTTATPVSTWTVAEPTDAEQSGIPVSRWVAQEAALQSQATAPLEEEALPPLPTEAPPRKPSAAPVSKWTLVDYDEDNPPADLEGQEGTDIFTGAGSDTPVMEEAAAEGTPPHPPAMDDNRSGKPSTPLDPAGPMRKSTELRNDAAEEERRQKLRQVELAVMMFREQLEEDSEGKTKAQVEAEVSEHRAKLLADAEESNKTEPSKSDSKSGRSRVADKGKVRDADKPKDSVDKLKKQGKSDTKSSSKEAKASKRDAPKDEAKLSRRESERGIKRRRSRSRTTSCSRGRSASRSRSRERHQGRREEKSSRKSTAKDKESVKDEKHTKGKSREKSDRIRSESRSPERSSRSKAKQREKDERDTKKRRDRSRSRSRDMHRSRSRSRSRDRKSRRR